MRTSALGWVAVASQPLAPLLMVALNSPAGGMLAPVGWFLIAATAVKNTSEGIET